MAAALLPKSKSIFATTNEVAKSEAAEPVGPIRWGETA